MRIKDIIPDLSNITRNVKQGVKQGATHVAQAAQKLMSAGIVSSPPAITLPTHVVFTQSHPQKESAVAVKVVQLNHTNKTFELIDSFSMNVKKYPQQDVQELEGPYVKRLISAVKKQAQNVKTVHLIPFGDDLSQVFASLGSTRLLKNVPYSDYRNEAVIRMFGSEPTSRE